MDREILIHPHRCHLDDYYEYHVYNSTHSLPSSYNVHDGYGYGACPILILSRHQGFRFNEELFVNGYSRSVGCECHVSTSQADSDRRRAKLQHHVSQEQQSSSSFGISTPSYSHSHDITRYTYYPMSARSPSTSSDVIDINLTKAECDVLP